MRRGKLRRNQQPGSVSAEQSLAKREGQPKCRACGAKCRTKDAIRGTGNVLKCPACGGILDRQG